MRIDQCVFDDNKSAYFLKCTSVDNPWPKIRVAENVKHYKMFDHLVSYFRTEDPPAAKELLKVLNIDWYFSYKEIYPGSKVTHFKK